MIETLIFLALAQALGYMILYFCLKARHNRNPSNKGE